MSMGELNERLNIVPFIEVDGLYLCVIGIKFDQITTKIINLDTN